MARRGSGRAAIAGVIAGAVLAVACVPSRRLDLTSEPGEQTLVIASSGDGLELLIEAVPLGDEPPELGPTALRVAEKGEHDLRYTAMFHRMSLEQLNLARGVVRPAAEGERSVALPRGERVLSWSSGEAGGPEETGELPEDVAAFQIPAPPEPPNPCDRFMLREVVTTATGAIVWVEPAGRESALLGSSDGKLLRAERTTEVSIVLNGAPDKVFTTAREGPDGAIWLGASDGSLYRTTAVREETIALDEVFPPAGRGLLWIDISPAGAPFEMLLLYDDGRIERYDKFERLTVQVGGEPNSRPFTVINWSSPGEAVAIGPAGILRVRGTTTKIEAPPPGTGELTALGTTHGVRDTMIAAMRGAEVVFLRFDTDRQIWVDLAPPFAGPPIRKIAQFYGGFIWAGDGGRIGQFRYDAGLCAPLPPARPNFRQLMRIAQNAIAGGEADPTGTRIVWLDWIPPR